MVSASTSPPSHLHIASGQLSPLELPQVARHLVRVRVRVRGRVRGRGRGSVWAGVRGRGRVRG